MASKLGVRKGSAMEPPILPSSLVQGINTASPGTGRSPDSRVPNPQTSYFNTSITNVRNLPPLDAIQALARINGDVSTAVWSTVRLANTAVKFLAYDTKHQIDPAGALLVKSLLARMEYPYDYSQGFDSRPSLAGVRETLLRSVFLFGACDLELVLDSMRLPHSLHPIASDTLSFTTTKARIGKALKVVPQQSVQGEGTIALDYPTIFHASLDQDPKSAYPQSPLEPALNSSSGYAELLEDVRRVVRRSGHSRLTVKLLREEILKSAPPDVRGDPARLSAWMTEVRDRITSELENLTPEMALVFFDTVEASYLNSDIGSRADYSPLLETFDGVQSTSLKTPPSVLGKRRGGSQNTSSTESLLFIKTASALQPPVASVLSRALTLSARLYGFDGYVKAEFEPINLRPAEELEAFSSMKQARTLELLSLGFLTDEQAAEVLGTGPKAPGAPALSGTFFYDSKKVETPSPNSDPARRALVPDTPDKAGGKSQ